MMGKNTITRFASGDVLLYALSGIFILIAYNVFFGLETLLPTNISWLLSARHDWGQHYLGWAFYRNEPWTFPLGQIDALCYPGGTNVGYWDSIPLLAMFFKLFSPLLPDDFQYLGLWLLFCYFMAAWYTIKIFKIYTAKTVYILIGVLFIACNPVLVYRGLHPALCAHGFIIAAIYYYLKPATLSNVRALNRHQMVLAITSALVNPYICMMVLGFSVILPARHYYYGRLLRLGKAVFYITATVIAIVAVWLLVGMLELGETSQLQSGSSYGILSFNLNSLFNSGGFSTFLPQMPWLSPGQYEGYMYLGLGMMVAIVLAFLCLIYKGNGIKLIKNNKYILLLMLLTFAFSIFAISHRVTYGEILLFEVNIPEFVNKIGSIFRASGRFLWPLYYVIYLFSILILVKSRFPEGLKMTVLAFLLALQLYDSKPMYTFRNLVHGAYDSPLDEAKWKAVLPGFDRMITYPPFNNHLLNNMDYQDLCFIALKNNKAISMGYSARENQVANKAYIDSLDIAMQSNELSDRELYITTPQHIDAFGAVIHNGKFEVGYLDGYYLLYPKSKSVNNIIAGTPETIKKTDSIKAVYSQTKFLKVIDKPAFTKDRIKFNIETLVITDNNIRIKGWAFLEEKTNNKGDSVFVTLSGGNKTYIINTTQILRNDITAAFKKENLENSGFSAFAFTDHGLEKDDYSIGLAIRTADNKWTFESLGTRGEIEKKEKPVKLDKLPAMQMQAGNVDGYEVTKAGVMVSGWTVFTDADATDNEIMVVFMREGQNYAVPVKGIIRQDVTAAYDNKYKYDTSGFSVSIRKKDLKKGEYKIGVLLRNTRTGRESLMETDKKLTVQ